MGLPHLSQNSDISELMGKKAYLTIDRVIFHRITIIEMFAGYKVPFHNINGGITSHSEHKGFRKFIKAGADKYCMLLQKQFRDFP